MIDFLRDLLRVATIVFTVASMLSVGFSYTVAEILGPLRRVSFVLRALIANFVLVPLLTVLLIRAIPLDPPIALGLLLLGLASGAPFLIKLLDVAEGNFGKGATLLVLLAPITVLFLPFAVSWALDHPALTGIAQDRIRTWTIARPLLLTVLLPFAAGLLFRDRAPGWAKRLQPSMGRTASVALLVVVACSVITNLRGIVQLVGFPMLAVLLLFLGAFAIGYVIGGPTTERRVVLGLGTGQRNIADAMVVSTQAIGDPDCTLMVIVGSLLGMLALFPIAALLGRRAALPAPAGEAHWGDHFGTPVRG